jgi:glycosyltransferase involved in cell wall biosynthesis
LECLCSLREQILLKIIELCLWFRCNIKFQQLFQAMALKTPVIARNIPGNTAVVDDGQNGIVFDTPEVITFFYCIN